MSQYLIDEIGMNLSYAAYTLKQAGFDDIPLRGVYSQVSTAMRAELTTALQERWAASLRERAQLAPRSIVPVLDALLAGQRPLSAKIRSQIAPKPGQETGKLRPGSQR